jgi:hypothetical protein
MASSWLVKFLKLPGNKKRSLLRALAVLWTIRVALWLLPYSSVRNLASTMKARPKIGEPSVDEIVQSVETASQFVIAATCLTKALAAKMLLARNGYISTLRIGVDTCNGFAAHAWIEREGKVILGGSTGQYKPLYILE